MFTLYVDVHKSEVKRRGSVSLFSKKARRRRRDSGQWKKKEKKCEGRRRNVGRWVGVYGEGRSCEGDRGVKRKKVEMRKKKVHERRNFQKRIKIKWIDLTSQVELPLLCDALSATAFVMGKKKGHFEKASELGWPENVRGGGEVKHRARRPG